MPGALDWLMGLMGGGPKAQVVGDGVTYGPAVSRLTRTPIDFSNDTPYAGQYFPDENRMVVNPKNSNDVGTTVRHESVHALMAQPNMLQAATSGPAMSDLMHSMSRVVGDPQAEIPAYVSQDQPGMKVMGSNYTSQWSNTARNAALTEMLKNVKGKDASAGSILERLSNVPPRSY